MADSVRVGLVGADASGSGWGSVAHVPALRAADGIELAAVCTSRPESATAAGEAYGVRSFHDVRDLAAQPDIDVVSVVVRVPKHRELVLAALEGGKHVFSEWPLGANLAEAEEMATVASTAGVVTAVGLQGRHDPSLTYIKQLHSDGWLGRVIAVNVTMMGGGALEHRSADAWMGVNANGANFLTIVGGHTIDAVAHCLSPFAELSASVATLVPEWYLTDTGETIEVDAPDNVAVNGVLQGGAMVSLQAGSVPFNASGWRMEITAWRARLSLQLRVFPRSHRSLGQRLDARRCLALLVGAHHHVERDQQAHHDPRGDLPDGEAGDRHDKQHDVHRVEELALGGLPERRRRLCSDFVRPVLRQAALDFGRGEALLAVGVQSFDDLVGGQ